MDRLRGESALDGEFLPALLDLVVGEEELGGPGVVHGGVVQSVPAGCSLLPAVAGREIVVDDGAFGQAVEVSLGVGEEVVLAGHGSMLHGSGVYRKW